MIYKTIHILGLFISVALAFATSIGKVETSSYTVAGGYSQAVGSSSAYLPNPVEGTSVHRYLYSAFQRGYAEGNLQTQVTGGRFEYLPQMGVNHLRLENSNYSTVEVWFNKDARYRVQSAVLGILERQPDFHKGTIEISVNGRIIEHTHAAWETIRFQESTWQIEPYLQDGLNQVKIRLERGGAYSLLGIKVETRESFGNGGHGPGQKQRWVREKFQQYHFRLPSDSELSYYVGLLRNGHSFTDVERMIRNLSSNPLPGDQYDQLVTEYFQRYAGRLPTDYERRDYAQRLRSNQLSLPEFRRILENMNPVGGNVEQKIRNIFLQVLQREPSTEELAHYARKLREGSMTWEQFQREVQYLGQGGNNSLPLTIAEVQALDFRTVVLNSAFLKRLDATPRPVLRSLMQRAQHVHMYAYSHVEKANAQAIISRIRSQFPQMN